MICPRCALPLGQPALRCPRCLEALPLGCTGACAGCGAAPRCPGGASHATRKAS